MNVVYMPGTNCQVETIKAFKRVGADPRLLYLPDLLGGTTRLDSADILCIPGGFSFGDHLGAGVVAGLLLSTRLRSQFRACLDRLMLCICNGFQIAVRAGCFGPGIALRPNACGTFQDVPEQPHLVAADNGSPWLEGLAGEQLRFACAHGEGRLVYKEPGSWKTALTYPKDENPDGSMDDIAGITSANGLIFGLMNHPERALHEPMNLAIFSNGVRAVT